MPLRRDTPPSSLDFSDHEVERYSRHILLPEIGAAGQARLRDSHLLVIGAGGLGSPALLYLAAAGVGRITIVDHDRVETSNLQRQVLHTTQSVGRAKVESATERLRAINPLVEIQLVDERFSAANARQLVRGKDAVLDGCDNFTTRYLSNDACFFERVPLISAAVFRFEGQLTTFTYQDSSPCYRCLFPSPPPAGSVPACSEAGVLGAVVGTLGTMQATEAVKLLTGAGELLVARLLRYDALRMESTVFGFAKNPTCALCGASPAITGVQAINEPGCEA